MMRWLLLFISFMHQNDACGSRNALDAGANGSLLDEVARQP